MVREKTSGWQDEFARQLEISEPEERREVEGRALKN
jgi:hypothetical protein